MTTSDNDPLSGARNICPLRSIATIFRADPTRYSKDRPGVVELYDLEEDPLEQRNLAGTKKVADAQKTLSAELWRWMRDTEDPLLHGPVPSPRYRLAMKP